MTDIKLARAKGHAIQNEETAAIKLQRRRIATPWLRSTVDFGHRRRARLPVANRDVCAGGPLHFESCCLHPSMPFSMSAAGVPLKPRIGQPCGPTDQGVEADDLPSSVRRRLLTWLFGCSPASNIDQISALSGVQRKPGESSELLICFSGIRPFSLVNFGRRPLVSPARRLTRQEGNAIGRRHLGVLAKEGVTRSNGHHRGDNSGRCAPNGVGRHQGLRD